MDIVRRPIRRRSNTKHNNMGLTLFIIIYNLLNIHVTHTETIIDLAKVKASEGKKEMHHKSASFSEESAEKILPRPTPTLVDMKASIIAKPANHAAFSISPLAPQNQSDLERIISEKYQVDDLVSDESSYDDTEKLEIAQLKYSQSDGFQIKTQSARNKKAQLLRSQSRHEWQQQDVVERIKEFKKEITHLSAGLDVEVEPMELEISMTDSEEYETSDDFNEPTIPDHTLNANAKAGTKNANLFRIQSSYKWDNTKKEALREEFAKHMIHLASSGGVALPPSTSVDDE